MRKKYNKKGLIKTNEVEYYFLSFGLTEEEKEFFDSCYTQINCDFVYNLNNIELEN